MLEDIIGNRKYTIFFQVHFSHMIRLNVQEKIIRSINYTNLLHVNIMRFVKKCVIQEN